MRRHLQRLRRDESGAGVIEFAIAVPILTVFIYGIYMVGTLFEANAGMQHALGEASRYATLWPTPSDANISAKVQARKFGLQHGVLSDPSIDNTQIASGYKTITLTYTQPTDFLLFSGPSITLVRSKRVYIAS